MLDADDQSIGRLLLYQTEDGRSRIEVRLDQGQLWLTQSAIAKLFQTTPQNITTSAIHLCGPRTDRSVNV